MMIRRRIPNVVIQRCWRRWFSISRWTDSKYFVH